MPLFRRGAGPDQEAARAAQAEQQASVEALARGGLPARAAERLQVAAGVFTSSFSVDEFALAGLEGFRPVAQVMGSSVYHVGWQRKPGGGWGWQAVSQELTVLSEAWNEARRLAFGRLEEEATLAGGEAVVGLQLRTGAHDWLAGAVEYVVFGTAVRRDGQRAAPPVLTNLSAQEYRLLSKAGYRPAGLFGASGVFYVVSGWQQQQAQFGWGSWANQELRDFTQGLYDAREVTIGRLTRQAREHDAVGLVGVSLTYSVEEREVEQAGSHRTDLVVTMHALGTAIAPVGAEAAASSTRVAVDLSSDRRKDHVLGGTR